MTMCRRPRLMRAFWVTEFAKRKAGRRMPARLVVGWVRRELGVRRFDVAPIYPRAVFWVQRWMTCTSMVKAFPHVGAHEKWLCRGGRTAPLQVEYN